MCLALRQLATTSAMKNLAFNFVQGQAITQEVARRRKRRRIPPTRRRLASEKLVRQRMQPLRSWRIAVAGMAPAVSSLDSIQCMTILCHETSPRLPIASRNAPVVDRLIFEGVHDDAAAMRCERTGSGQSQRPAAGWSHGGAR
jgi:hypothetical protein